MSAERQLQRETDALEQRLADGLITVKEFNSELRELERDYRESAHEAARDAYNRELENW